MLLLSNPRRWKQENKCAAVCVRTRVGFNAWHVTRRTSEVCTRVWRVCVSAELCECVSGFIGFCCVCEIMVALTCHLLVVNSCVMCINVSWSALSYVLFLMNSLYFNCLCANKKKMKQRLAAAIRWIHYKCVSISLNVCLFSSGFYWTVLPLPSLLLFSSQRIEFRYRVSTHLYHNLRLNVVFIPSLFSLQTW